MRRRILVAMVGVTIVATLVLTVPLAILIAKRERLDAHNELDHVAERVAADITRSDLIDGDVAVPPVERTVKVGVYLPNGRRVAGTGPARADDVTSDAKVLTVDGFTGSERVLARPVVEAEQKIAIVRVAEPRSEADRVVRRDLLVLLVFDAAAVGVAAAIGAFVAARMVRPLRSIRDDAVRLGDGDFSIAPSSSGVAELDETAAALADTAARLHGVLQRERAFSADASHQLRTPLTSLRLAIENEMEPDENGSAGWLDTALGEIDRLEETIETLIDVARDHPIARDLVELVPWSATVSSRWTPMLGGAGRTFRARVPTSSARVSRAVLDQIVDTLISNAMVHGVGEVAMDVAIEDGHLSVTVRDQGRLGRDPAELFVRRDPGATGHGIGLSLARSLAEAEGGRLVVASAEPTSVRLLLPILGEDESVPS